MDRKLQHRHSHMTFLGQKTIVLIFSSFLVQLLNVSPPNILSPMLSINIGGYFIIRFVHFG